MKHIIDQAHGTRGARLRRYAEIERTHGKKQRPQTETLRRAPRGLSTALRVKEFLKIEHAHT